MNNKHLKINISTSFFSHLRGYSKRKQIIIGVITLLVLLSLLTTVVYAAFFSAGHRKGIAVANGFYFSSNVLTSMGSVDSEAGNYFCVSKSQETQLSINIRNYDLKLFPDPFDITYTLIYQLVGENKENGKYSYTLSFNGQNYNVETTRHEITGLKLDALKLSSHNFVLKFTQLADSVLNDAATVRIIAVPTDPDQMKNYIIGSDISLAAPSTDFSASGEFNDIPNAETDTTNLAGFLYNVTTSGNIKNDHKAEIILIWDYRELELDQQSPYITDTSYEKNTDTYTASLTLQVDAGEYLSFVFFRPIGCTQTLNPNNALQLNYREIQI